MILKVLPLRIPTEVRNKNAASPHIVLVLLQITLLILLTTNFLAPLLVEIAWSPNITSIRIPIIPQSLLTYY